MIVNLLAIADEIAKPIYTGKGDAEILDMEISVTNPKIPTWQIKRHAIMNLYWSKIRIAADPGSNKPEAIREIAIAAHDYLIDDAFETMDFSLPEVQQMLAGLVAAGLMTASQKTSLLALTQVTTKFSEAFGCDHVDIAEARKLNA